MKSWGERRGGSVLSQHRLTGAGKIKAGGGGPCIHVREKGQALAWVCVIRLRAFPSIVRARGLLEAWSRILLLSAARRRGGLAVFADGRRGAGTGGAARRMACRFRRTTPCARTILASLPCAGLREKICGAMPGRALGSNVWRF